MKNTALLSLTFLVIACTSKEGAPNISSLHAPTGSQASLPHLFTGEDNNLYLSWVEKGDSNMVTLYYATMKNDSWSTPESIASGTDWFVNWADYPMIAVDKEGNMVAHFLAKSSSGTYSYDVNVMYKPTGGKWIGPVIPHTDGTPTEHGFTTLLPQNDGTFLVAWLDGRNTSTTRHEGHDMHESGGAMTIRSAVLDMQGNLTQEVELDNRVCDCCQTAGALTSAGPAIAYRDRSAYEIRDMAMVRWKNGSWTEPTNASIDNWHITGCPVNGPRLSAIENTLGMAWFTAANGQPKVNVRFSSDAGETFGNTIEVATETVGRVDLAMIDSSSAAVSWLAANDTASYIMTCRVNTDGTKSAPLIVTQTSASRASGFPQLTRWKNKNYFAWTHVDENTTAVKMAVVEE